MGKYTEYTRRWLERRFGETTAQGLYYAHQPIYGVGHAACERGHGRRLARTYQILRQLARLEFETLLDVGGGEGFLAYQVRRLLGAASTSCDLSVEACRRAWELFELDAAAVSSHRLPFGDGAFDVVVSSEMIEHVEYPVEALAELGRVARRAVVLTTEEVELDRAVIDKHLFERCGYPHFERNLFHPDDLRLLLGEPDAMLSQIRGEAPADPLEPAAARAWIAAATATGELVPGGIGVVLVKAEPGVRRAEPTIGDGALLDALLEPAHAAVPLAPRPRREPLGGLLSRAVCPDCGGSLRSSEHEVECAECGARYPVVGGIADLASRRDACRAETARRLQARWDAGRAGAALDLRDRLDLPVDAAVRHWDFAAVEQRRGWMPNGDLAPRAGDGWAFEVTGGDPWLVSPGLGIPFAEVRELDVALRIHNPAYGRDAGSGQVFWIGGDDTTFAEERSVHFPLINDGDVHRYRVPLADHPAWPPRGELVCLRLDPADGPCELGLVSLSVEGPA